MKGKYLEDGRNRVLRNYTPFTSQKTTRHNHNVIASPSSSCSPKCSLLQYSWPKFCTYFVYLDLNTIEVFRVWCFHEGDLWRMSTSEMLRLVALLYTNVSKECVATTFRAEAVTRAKNTVFSVPENWSQSVTYRLRLSSFALLLLPWKWRWHFPPKRRCIKTHTELHPRRHHSP